jgi:RpiB/LacA/LacB family sugar-phosphate isomerase
VTNHLTRTSPLCLKSTKVVGIAADHGGHELKEYLAAMLREAGAEVIDFGNHHLIPQDDYPDFVIPLARAVAGGQVDRGVAICGSGVGACITANKVDGVRACLIHDPFSAHQGVEDDDLNLICLGGLVVGHALAWELVRSFLTAQFSGKERHHRRLEKVAALESAPTPHSIAAPAPAEDPSTPASDAHRETPPLPDAHLKLYLIRHGETEWTASGRHTGCTDIPLTAIGEDEVRQWGHLLSAIPFSHVLCSPRQRAKKTCALVGLAGAAETEPDLTEWDYGDYEGLSSIEIRKLKKDWNIFHDGCPNGESPARICARADRLIARLQTMEGSIALFSHGQFGAVLAARWIMLSVAEAVHFPLGTAALNILSYHPHHRAVPVIELWNSAPHEASRHGPESHPPHHLSMKQSSLQRWENEGGEIPTCHPDGPLPLDEESGFSAQGV